jgi:hypothetical protein
MDAMGARWEGEGERGRGREGERERVRVRRHGGEEMKQEAGNFGWGETG